jgi:hypothetical protein
MPLQLNVIAELWVTFTSASGKKKNTLTHTRARAHTHTHTHTKFPRHKLWTATETSLQSMKQLTSLYQLLVLFNVDKDLA